MNILIITSYLNGKLNDLKSLFPSNKNFDYVVACDGGLKIAQSLHIEVNLIVGDFDSYGSIPSCNKKTKIIQLPREKDYSDFHFALLEVFKIFSDKDISLYILGGVGGRLDHTMGNIQSICRQIDKFQLCTFIDYENTMHIFSGRNKRFNKPVGTHFGLIALSPTIENLSITGAKYTMKNGILSNINPIGISNLSTDDTIEISFSEGILAVIFTNEENNQL